MIVHVEEESDVLCGMRTYQRRHKANEADMTYTNKIAIAAYSQTICEEVMSAVPDNSGFIFRIAIFFSL